LGSVHYSTSLQTSLNIGIVFVLLFLLIMDVYFTCSFLNSCRQNEQLKQKTQQRT